MVKHRTYLQDTMLCLAGFVAGAYGGSMLTGPSKQDLPEPQQIQWRHEHDVPGLDHVADDKPGPGPDTRILRETRQ